MPNQCNTCEHPSRATIDAALVAGRPQRQLAREFGLSRDSVRRHVQGAHVAGMPATAPAIPAMRGGDGSPVAAMREALDALRAVDLSTLSPSAQVARIEAIRRTAESLHRAEPATVEERPLQERPDFQEVQGAMADVLEPFPLVRNLLAVRCGAEDVGISQGELWNTVRSVAEAFAERGDGSGAEAPLRDAALAWMAERNARVVSGTGKGW